MSLLSHIRKHLSTQAPQHLEDLHGSIGWIIFEIVEKHGGEMKLSVLLTALIQEKQIPCVHRGQTLHLEFVVGDDLYPVIRVQREDGKRWQVSLNGPNSDAVKEIYEQVSKSLTLQVEHRNGIPMIQCNGVSGASLLLNLLIPRQATVAHVNAVLARRIFDDTDSTVVSRTDL